MSASRKAAEQTKLNDWLEGLCTPALADGDQPIYGNLWEAQKFKGENSFHASCVARGLLLLLLCRVQIGAKGSWKI